jgi:formylglycine-generating enzyme required for sulfatase activity
MLRPHLAIPATLCLAATAALAQSDPSGIDFVTIGSPGNPAYQSSNPNDLVNGRGSVDYSYRIGRDEVPTSLWVQFFNDAFDRPASDSIPFISFPGSNFWGASAVTPNNPGGHRWAVPSGNEMIPVGDISWRTAAVFCNWLSNGQGTSRSAFLSGAYDTSTFNSINGVFTDQVAHSPGAQYWIPTWDEWLKAAHWSPSNPSNGGWYNYSNGSDSPYIYGPPGQGQANAGFSTPNPFSIPLGSYPTVQSPWGLLDVAGGTQEWTESVDTLSGGIRYRIFDGSFWNEDSFQANGLDQIRNFGAEFPWVDTYNFGLRVASVIPAPPSCVVGIGVLSVLIARRRTR